jgi:UDPglucose 6-dehydrogenase
MKLGVIGGGVVGAAMARAFMEHAEVRVYDVVKERATHTLAQVLDSDICFVCLPTPQQKDGLAADTSAIDAFFRQAIGYPNGKLPAYVLRSTVPIGTTRKLKEKYGLPRICHSAEFLTARCALTDAQTPARNIVGATDFNGGLDTAASRLTELYAKRFPGVPIHQMTSDESEATKLFVNGFFAVKVAFFNECYWFADALGLDWETVMEGVLADGRIAHSHTKVPGVDGRAGFGGFCLPKDLASFVHQIAETGETPFVTHAALQRNFLDRERSIS